ncbi:sugar phosphate isomerase/epimerase [Pedobacter gandavensis]|uniref:sugar phosphate isomerase/epimerase family protein n=1 Tax=Pedobacter gandavensis TaxID=2679963 RepID=UPI00247A8895|nr:sugar phosphate isomerase/epimerase [Pedobacter gandavensis]WGQ11351.1 sugar phosphate isomerase/epimerase [Pedobacter gandavensis]
MTKLLFYCPYWGMRPMPITSFLEKARNDGYHGVEIALNPDTMDIKTIKEQCDDAQLELIAQHPYAAGITANEMLPDYLSKLERILAIEPVMVNCHTGRDYFSIPDNLKFLTAADQLSKAAGISVSHEIHRGRFSFCAPLISDYFEAFPELKLTADFSHWCVVSESLLEQQQATLDRAIQHCSHLHARVGYAQGPQVPHPFAPEYHLELQQHLSWWMAILKAHISQQKERLTITCEFGPSPYMHSLPFTNAPIASQWELNLLMKTYLQDHLKYENN